jgi:lysophospholipase L1-like esterase
MPGEQYRIFLVGDSTMADKPLVDNPEHGWGQVLPAFFSHKVSIFNHARNGRSTRSFLLEGRWTTVMNQVRPGDYIFIQFGHNDSKKDDTSRYAPAQTDYRQNLIRFVREAKEKQAIPVLITLVNRRNYDTTGTFIDKHGEYPDVVRDVARIENIPLIDLHKSSKALLENLGPERSKALFLVGVRAGVFKALPNGKEDNTHFTRQGAFDIAGLVVQGLRELELPLGRELLPNVPSLQEGYCKVVGLDEYYNNEWKNVDTAKRIRWHYIWEDTTNGGFSELGRLVDQMGADLDTLQTAPTKESLRRFSVYIIVDPDTPKETLKPNMIESEATDAIETWVKEGGILVLMGNDKDNIEFEHYNVLSERFGIHFNEDSHHAVRGKEYETGRTTSFPGHPMFRNVSSIFMKEICSLTIKPPATELLRENNIVMMAEARIGRGFVVAVGDPWLYNEYFDNRKLPEGFENRDAAAAFLRWLLENARPVR